MSSLTVDSEARRARARNALSMNVSFEVGIERRALGTDRAAALVACQDQACLIADSRRIDRRHVRCPAASELRKRRSQYHRTQERPAAAHASHRRSVRIGNPGRSASKSTSQSAGELTGKRAGEFARERRRQGVRSEERRLIFEAWAELIEFVRHQGNRGGAHPRLKYIAAFDGSSPGRGRRRDGREIECHRSPGVA